MNMTIEGYFVTSDGYFMRDYTIIFKKMSDLQSDDEREEYNEIKELCRLSKMVKDTLEEEEPQTITTT